MGCLKPLWKSSKLKVKRFNVLNSSDSSKTCIYLLHGFATAPKYPSEKSDVLESVFKLEVKQIAYDSAASFEDNFLKLKQQVDTPPKFFVGTSLGAFYASQLAEYFYEKYAAAPILLNPCHNPFEIMDDALGQHTNYVTEKTFEFRQQALDSYRNIPFIHAENDMPRFILLNMDDELIDAQQTVKLYADVLSLFAFQQGGHRFENIGSDEVVCALQSMI